MAIVTNNDLTRGLRGRIGKHLVFRTFGGKTIASRAPRKPDPKKESTAQQQTRATFKKAAAWAVGTLQDPERKRYYQQRAEILGLPNAYTAAVKEYMSGGVSASSQEQATSSVGCKQSQATQRFCTSLPCSGVVPAVSNRERKRAGRAAIGGTVDIERASMRIHYAFNERKTKSGPGNVTGIPRTKHRSGHAPKFIFRNTNAVVRDLYNSLSVDALQGNDDFAVGILQGIIQNIIEHDIQELRVAGNKRRINITNNPDFTVRVDRKSVV